MIQRSRQNLKVRELVKLDHEYMLAEEAYRENPNDPELAAEFMESEKRYQEAHGEEAILLH